MGIIYYYVFGILGLIGILGAPIAYCYLSYKNNYEKVEISAIILFLGIMSAFCCGLVSINIF